LGSPLAIICGDPAAVQRDHFLSLGFVVPILGAEQRWNYRLPIGPHQAERLDMVDRDQLPGCRPVGQFRAHIGAVRYPTVMAGDDERKCPKLPVLAEERARVLVINDRHLASVSSCRKVPLPCRISLAKVPNAAPNAPARRPARTGGVPWPRCTARPSHGGVF